MVDVWVRCIHLRGSKIRVVWILRLFGRRIFHQCWSLRNLRGVFEACTLGSPNISHGKANLRSPFRSWVPSCLPTIVWTDCYTRIRITIGIYTIYSSNGGSSTRRHPITKTRSQSTEKPRASHPLHCALPLVDF